ncbi:uncharacterized protein LOC118477165 [Aplysia californica]|uniref:Uncharacterized protein LOC118477165 n=1 Tax=Aplysia californica TaxID=6500 RepID=A0ABM1VUZ0_APLCA|nr:uncharacterized protein LOC118477165 [Aplysia californica]
MLPQHRITANLKKGTRTVSAQILLDVVSGNPPQVAIIPSSGSVYYQMSNGYKVLKSSRLGLDCVCMDCSASDVITYQWKVMMADYRWPDNWRPLEQVDVLDRVLGYESKQISIEASLFETFNSQQMRAECVLTRAGEWGKVASDLMVNNPPAPGTCTVSPFNRTITSEEAWTISVDSWSDEDGIDEYQFFIHTDEDTVDKQITSVKTEQGTLSIQVSLSEGPHYLNYKQTIIVKVRDMLGSIQEYDCGQVVFFYCCVFSQHGYHVICISTKTAAHVSFERFDIL